MRIVAPDFQTRISSLRSQVSSSRSKDGSRSLIAGARQVSDLPLVVLSSGVFDPCQVEDLLFIWTNLPGKSETSGGKPTLRTAGVLCGRDARDPIFVAEELGGGEKANDEKHSGAKGVRHRYRLVAHARVPAYG